MPQPFYFDDSSASQPQIGMPDWLVVKMAALRLMSVHGTTTARELEFYLHSRGYYGYQQDLDSLLDCIAAGEGWTLLFNGRQKVYCLGVDTEESCPCYLLGFSDN